VALFPDGRIVTIETDEFDRDRLVAFDVVVGSDP
jgi:hypothetical protein